MAIKNEIKLSKEQKQEMSAAIKEYFLNEREEELGDLAAVLILDFITVKLGPQYYNQGVYDAYNYMCERNEDLLSIQIF